MESAAVQDSDRLVGWKEVSRLTGIRSRQTLLTKEQRKEFPRRRYLSATCVRWVESEIVDWVHNLPCTLDELAERRAAGDA